MAALPNIAAEYLHGLEVGSHITAEKRRIALDSQRLEQEGQMHQSQLAQQMAIQQMVNQREHEFHLAQLETAKAYHQAQLGLRAARIQQFEEFNAQKTKAAAERLADQKGFADDLAGGMPVDQALYRHPTLSTPMAAVQAAKAVDPTSAERLKLSARRLDLQERQVGDSEKRPPKIGTMDIPLPQLPNATNSFNNPMMRGVPLNSPLINQTMGTNAPPGTGTNYAGGMPIPPAAVPAGGAAIPFKEGQPIRSKKDGKLYRVINGIPVPLSADAPTPPPAGEDSDVPEELDEPDAEE